MKVMPYFSSSAAKDGSASRPCMRAMASWPSMAPPLWESMSCSSYAPGFSLTAARLQRKETLPGCILTPEPAASRGERPV